MVEIFSSYGIYIAIGAVAVICFGIGGLINYLESNRIKNTLTATVMDCKQVEKAIDGMYLKSYEITLELYIGGTTVTKTILRGKEMQQWERVNVIYDSDNDEVTLQEIEKKNGNEVPKVLAVLGMVMIVVDFITIFITNPSMDDRTKAHLAAIAGVSIFTFIGLYLCVIIPSNRNKRSYNCDLVKGTQIDYVRVSRRRISLLGKINFTSMPIYEYYYNGEVKKLRGSIGGTSKKYRENGRSVTIAVDRVTKEAYCVEEEDDTVKSGVIIVGCTVVFIALIASWI